MTDVDQKLLAAEYIATHEMVEDWGEWFGFAERCADLARRQMDAWVDDQRAFCDELSGGEPPANAVAGHVLRSTRHAVDGATALATLYLDELDRLSKVHDAFWRPLRIR